MSGSTDILANMVHGWGRDPSARLAGTPQTGISAALWTGNDPSPLEVSAFPDETMHIVCVQLNAFEAEMFVDGRLHYKRRHVAGSSSIVRAGESPRAIVNGEWKVLHIYVPCRMVTAIAETEELTARPNQLELICHRGTPEPTIAAIGRQIVNEASDKLPFCRLRLDALGHELVIHLLRTRSNLASVEWSQNIGAGLAPWQIKRARDCLENLAASETSLATLGSAVGLSPFHFARAFKASTGIPPHRYLVDLRIQKARDLLESTDLPIIEVAALVGYDSPSYLARLFRREVGVTPAAYRRERRR